MKRMLFIFIIPILLFSCCSKTDDFEQKVKAYIKESHVMHDVWGNVSDTVVNVDIVTIEKLGTQDNLAYDPEFSSEVLLLGIMAKRIDMIKDYSINGRIERDTKFLEFENKFVKLKTKELSLDINNISTFRVKGNYTYSKFGNTKFDYIIIADTSKPLNLDNFQSPEQFQEIIKIAEMVKYTDIHEAHELYEAIYNQFLK